MEAIVSIDIFGQRKLRKCESRGVRVEAIVRISVMVMSAYFEVKVEG